MANDKREPTAHTPGPWRVASDNEDGPLTNVLADNKRKGAFVAQCGNEADARLIASAPDLKAALVAFIAAWERSGDNMSGAQMSAFYGAITAIARAKGPSPEGQHPEHELKTRLARRDWRMP